MMAAGTWGGVRGDKINPSKPQQKEVAINGFGPGYRDLNAEDKIQAGDIYFNPDWEVGGPWYLVRDDNDAIGKQYVPGEMKMARRPISE